VEGGEEGNKRPLWGDTKEQGETNDLGVSLQRQVRTSPPHHHWREGGKKKEDVQLEEGKEMREERGRGEN